ncbi:MAG: IS30 family transposase [Proteobacteria bacterium]|nr:IS30 family transposase [Pseudomonadota bacterium]
MPYVQLTSAERYVIYHLKLYRLSLREIGRRLGRSHATISRELKRNGPAISSWVYWHQGAHEQALERRKRPRHYRRRVHAPLVRYVEQSLRAEWSPDVIAAKLKMGYPNDIRMRVSSETVYRWVYRDAKQGGQLFNGLCRCHKQRRRQRRYGTGRGLIPGRVSIHVRPDLIATRQRFGDWKGDTVEGAKGSGNLTTHVERKSRYLIAGKLINKTALVTAQAATTVFRRIPKTLRHTLTLDNGKEFARFQEIEKNTGLTIYFADPYSAWQRGTNENTNGLLRRYFPKGMDFNDVTEKSLAYVVKKLNHRPRKCLGYRTPHEVFQDAKRGAVAM